MSHWGLYIIRVNHFLKSTLNEDETMVPTALWTLHRACAPRRTGVLLLDFLPFPRIVRGPVRADLWIWYPFFHIFLFSIPVTRYARYAPGGEIDTLFTRFYWRGWCTGPNETCPPGSKRAQNYILVFQYKCPQPRLVRLWWPNKSGIAYFP